MFKLSENFLRNSILKLFKSSILKQQNKMNISTNNKDITYFHNGNVKIPEDATKVERVGDKGLMWTTGFNNEHIIIDCSNATINGVAWEQYCQNL